MSGWLHTTATLPQAPAELQAVRASELDWMLSGGEISLSVHKLNHDSLVIQPTAQSLTPLSCPSSLSAQLFLNSKQLLGKSRKQPLFSEHEGSVCFQQTLKLVPTLSQNNPLKITPHPKCMVTVLSHLCLGLPVGLLHSVSMTQVPLTFVNPPKHARCPLQLTLLDFITLTLLSKQCIL
jgi:hypothetical protein